MAAITYTHEQIIDLLKTNPVFSIGFALDNNFLGVQANAFKNFGIEGLKKDRISMRNFLVSKLKTTEFKKAIDSITMAKYYNAMPSISESGLSSANPLQFPLPYTLGYSDYFGGLAPDPAVKSFSLDSLFSGLGAGLTAYANANADATAAGNAAGAGSADALLAAQAAAAKKEEEERLAAEAAKKKKTIIIVSVVGGVIVIGIIAALIISSNKKAAAVAGA